MGADRQTIVNNVLHGYAENYDITVVEPDEKFPLVATAQMHETESGYVLSRKAEMWSANNHEYVWIFSMPKLTDEFCKSAIEYSKEEGLKLIDWKNNKNHMCSRITALFICDEADASALETIKKCRIYKSFQFSLRGWMEVHTAALVTGTEQVCANRYGRQTGEYLEIVLHPEKAKKKSGNKLHIIKDMLD